MTDLAPDPWVLPPPNVRSMLVPSPGYVLVEADLERADAQVCAWDAGCPSLKRIFSQGLDVHSDNARSPWMYGPNVNPRHLHFNGMTFRDNAKRAVHLADYAGGASTLASSAGISRANAEGFLRYWTKQAHPEIGAWHDKYERLLGSRKLPVIKNAFGFRRMYTDRPERLLGQALAWVCQSTVAIVINRCLLRLYNDMELSGNWGLQLLGTFQSADTTLQVHDSVLMQVPAETAPDVFSAIHSRMQIMVPYTDPLIIPSALKWSPTSWGEMQKAEF